MTRLWLAFPPIAVEETFDAVDAALEAIDCPGEVIRHDVEGVDGVLDADLIVALPGCEGCPTWPIVETLANAAGVPITELADVLRSRPCREGEGLCRTADA